MPSISSVPYHYPNVDCCRSGCLTSGTALLQSCHCHQNNFFETQNDLVMPLLITCEWLPIATEKDGKSLTCPVTSHEIVFTSFCSATHTTAPHPTSSNVSHPPVTQTCAHPARPTMVSSPLNQTPTLLPLSPSHSSH